LAYGKAASVGGLFIPNVTYWLDSDPKCTAAESVEAACRNVIQALEARARIMRYELTDHEWTAIKPAG
jgi:hypothetical protein